MPLVSFQPIEPTSTHRSHPIKRIITNIHIRITLQSVQYVS